MNKQQLASKIWESANRMRSKIEANEYKDYILGFIFYKFLSNKEVQTLKEMGLENKELKNITEKNERIVNIMQNRIGYFISYENLFSTWIEMKNQFDISNVRDALSAFNRLINRAHKKVFEGIFITLQTGLSKLGDTTATQTKAVKDLIDLIKDIPMNEKQDYDVLGFIYEYLISNFAANAGKKAGEFYTPHEVSVLISEIVANFLQERESIEIYDPTSGSGSLLINIGKSVSKFVKNENKIKYYAQELKQNTYNLTRMNLIMRGILPENIITRNGDTLAEDWPLLDEKRISKPLLADAVVSNPPYSQNWDPTDMELDGRFKDYGLAPKAKADYAFLLHDLFHLKEDGIMTIVLPHGVLFRGGEEKNIRKNLIEGNKIDTIIGLPPKIFFGTGIPTLIMILKKNRNNTDVQIIDASKDFIKDGKNNKLKASDIKRIVDAVKKRTNIPRYSKIVSKDEIIKNDYNLNISKYIDSSEEPENYDIYALMFGGIPKQELNKYKDIWSTFTNIKESLFTMVNDSYYSLSNSNISEIINEDKDINKFKKEFSLTLKNFEEYLYKELINNMKNIDLNEEENLLSDEMFNNLDIYNLIDNYKAYQILDDEWNKISGDIEIIQKEGIKAVKQVDPNMVTKKKNGKEIIIQEGWVGHILPFELVQENMLYPDVQALNDKNNRLSEIISKYEEILDTMEQEEKELITNESGEEFDFKAVSEKAKEIKLKKIAIKPGSFEENITKVLKLHEEEKSLKKTIKTDTIKLNIKTKDTIENLSEEKINELLNLKWISPLVQKINKLPEELINNFIKEIENISYKYEETLIDIDQKITTVQNELSNIIDNLTGNQFDIAGLNELKSLLGDKNEPKNTSNKI